METKRLTVPAAEEILGRYFPVLDHGFVALKDYMGGDEAIDEAARCSYGAGTRQVSDRRGLIRRLMRMGHTSPFEMCELKFHCSMPIFVARQWIRHRMANVNEYSGRYSVVPMMFYMPDAEQFRKQSAKDKQGRGEAAVPAHVSRAQDLLAEGRAQAGFTYEWLVEEDFARELARIDLPLSTYTQWYWKIDLHNLLHFLSLRCDGHAQYEMRAFANVMAGMVDRVAPLSFEAWIDYVFAGARMSRQEMEVIRYLLQVRDKSPKRTLGVSNEARDWKLFETESSLESLGLTKTEVDEFFDKLDENEVCTSDFYLDPLVAKDAEYFQQKWTEAVPKVDKNST